MLSTATTKAMSVLPSMMLWAAISRARMPEAQFWFIDTAPLLAGSPSLMPTWRAGRDPWRAVRICPMDISSIRSAGTPERLMASSPAAIASSLACTFLRLPHRFPIAVLQALTNTTS